MLLSGAAAVAVPQATIARDPYKRSEITFKDINLGIGFSSVAFPSIGFVRSTWSYVSDSDFVVNIVFVGPYPGRLAFNIARDFEEHCSAKEKSEYFNCAERTANELGLGLIGLGDKYVTVVGKAKGLTRNHATSSANLLKYFVSPSIFAIAQNWISNTTAPFYTLFDPELLPRFNNITAPAR